MKGIELIEEHLMACKAFPGDAIKVVAETKDGSLVELEIKSGDIYMSPEDNKLILLQVLGVNVFAICNFGEGDEIDYLLGNILAMFVVLVNNERFVKIGEL